MNVVVIHVLHRTWALTGSLSEQLQNTGYALDDKREQIEDLNLELGRQRRKAEALNKDVGLYFKYVNANGISET